MSKHTFKTRKPIRGQRITVDVPVAGNVGASVTYHGMTFDRGYALLQRGTADTTFVPAETEWSPA